MRGEPFSLKAELHNFADLQYDVSSQGVINVGKIYQVFAKKGYNVNGTIAANVSLKGKQSDAVGAITISCKTVVHLKCAT